MGTMMEFTFPVGYQDFHKNKVFNFQFNRWNSSGYAREEDMRKAAAQTHDFNDWADVMAGVAKEAEQDGRAVNAAFYYRAAEFYLPPGNAQKAKLYEKFKTLIHPAIRESGIEILEIPYLGASLPCMRITRKDHKGVIVIHGGFDSFMEEFFSYVSYLYYAGYEVIVFEGPGQGDARRKFNLGFDYRWELPVKAVLDYFNPQDVTLLGISLGGYLCLRAAAFEPRIRRVIASSVAYDYPSFPPKLLQPIINLFYTKLTNYTNHATWKEIKKGGFKSWYFSNLMYMQKAEQPIDAIQYLTKMTAEELHCENITQDVLIMTGRDDHLVPFKMHQKQVDALRSANSVTGMVFDQSTHANNHCQIGNIKLSLDVITGWIQSHCAAQ